MTENSGSRRAARNSWSLGLWLKCLLNFYFYFFSCCLRAWVWIQHVIMFVLLCWFCLLAIFTWEFVHIALSQFCRQRIIKKLLQEEQKTGVKCLRCLNPRSTWYYIFLTRSCYASDTSCLRRWLLAVSWEVVSGTRGSDPLRQVALLISR